MKTLYFTFIESPECEAMLDEDGNLLDYWYSNDAMWRGEYFNGLMEKLGYKVVNSISRKHRKVLKDAIAED